MLVKARKIWCDIFLKMNNLNNKKRNTVKEKINSSVGIVHSSKIFQISRWNKFIRQKTNQVHAQQSCTIIMLKKVLPIQELI